MSDLGHPSTDSGTREEVLLQTSCLSLLCTEHGQSGRHDGAYQRLAQANLPRISRRNGESHHVCDEWYTLL
jgi:hypothetical protein